MMSANALGFPLLWRRRTGYQLAGVVAATIDRPIIWRTMVDDYVHQPFVGDIDGDGRNEIIIPGGDGLVTCLRTPGRSAGAPWSMTGGGPTSGV